MIEPEAPMPKIAIAVVKRESSTPSAENGSIMVRPDFGSYMKDIYDVYIPDIEVGDTIRYSGTRFERKNLDELENRIEQLELVTSPAEDDLRFSAIQLRQGANIKPDFDFTNIGLLFPAGNTTEAVFIVAQLPHNRQVDSAIEPHVHCRLSGAGQPIMKMEYKWYNRNGDTVPAEWSTYVMDTNSVVWTSGTISNTIYGAEPISGIGKGPSSILLIKLYRDDISYSGDLLVDEFDIHYMVDKFGEGTI